ncbi:hypothetical protein BDV93DRAFT_609635 [Ceratobasidium sp. AG-I]|nr:hypothetical protein BDV93DRAFT_609635 [Ceratobasidium sp. AG-I]
MSNACRVADIPELICSIATFLSDPRPLLLVSQHFFRSVAPLSWKSVPRVDVLLRLIPGTTERQTLFPDSWSTHSLLFDITLPSSVDLTRFDVYAPWVQRLEVFGGKNKHTLRNTAALLRLASTRHILPNLRALTLTMRAKASTDEYLSFIELFLSPMLVEIRHVRLSGNPPYLDTPPVTALVQKIRNVCPSIEVLEFYPADFTGTNPLGRTINFPSLGPCLRESLAGFSNLRSFSSTHHIFEPATLQVLGSLPLLESLDVFDYFDYLGDPASHVGGLTVLDSWFSALRHLHLRNFHAKDVSAVWNQPFVRNLESATIKCDPASAGENMCLATGQAWVDTFLTGLPQASPHISKLDLDFESAFLTAPGLYSLSHAGIDALRQLPLRSIRLRCLWTRCKDLVQAFPGVDEFCSMDVQVDLEQLRVFATHMPRLRSLTIDVCWVVPPVSDKASCQQADSPVALGSRPPVVLISLFKLVELKIPLAQLKEMAKFLAEIWPGGLRGAVYPGAWRMQDEVNGESLNQLNEAICEYLAEAAVLMP